MDLREISCEDERWLELAQDSIQLWYFELPALNLVVLLSELLKYCNKVDPKELGCGHERWMKVAQDSIQLWSFELSALNLRVPLLELDGS
jgi:hypothetical protein